MKRVIYYIIAFVFVVLLSPLVVHAYFEFNGTKDAEIVMKASVLAAFGRLPDPQVDDWGKDPDDPFLIQTPYHLKNLELLNNRGDLDGNKYYFRLLPAGGSSTLDMEGLPMKGIGTTEYPFRGVFDGNGKIIKDAVVVADSGEVDIGFFGNIAEGASAFNLILENTTITSVGNYVPFLPKGHATAKSGNDKEKCHIGVFCGHLDGEASNISIKDPVIEINSAAPGGSGDYMDYYSKYVTVGYCGDTATINNVLVSTMAPNVAADGDTGYWLTDFFYDNINQPVTYEENGQTHTTNFLAGLLQNPTSSSVPPWVLSAGRVVPAEGIFEYHTGGNSGYQDRIISIPVQTKINYYKTGSSTPITVDLTQNYDFNNQPDEFWIRRDLYNPYNGTFINSFKSGVNLVGGINNSKSLLVHPYTGNVATGDRIASGGIYFKFNKLTAQNPTAKIVCAVYSPSTMSKNVDLRLFNAASISQPITGQTRSVPAYNNAAGAVNVHVYEFTITQTLQQLNTVEYLLTFGNNGSADDPRILYIAVGGQHDNEHINTQKYAELPTIDFIYDTGIPVTHSNYVYTKILPYFLNGSKAAPVDELKLQFTRTPGTPNSFVIDAWGKDAAIDRLDHLGNTIFDYISRSPDDNFVLNRHSGPLPSMGMGILSTFGFFGAFSGFGFDEEPANAQGDLVFTLYTDREGMSGKAPLGGAVFRLTDTARIGNVLTATSQSDGTVSFTGVLHGTYYLEQINTPAYHNPMAPFYITISPSDGSVTKFGNGESGITGSYEVTNFIKRTSLTVRKTDEGGTPIGGVSLELYRVVNGALILLEDRKSDAVTGEAVFGGLMGGEYYVVKEQGDLNNVYVIEEAVDPDVLYVYVYK